MSIRFIYFDCLETLIQIDLPSFDVYADFAWTAGAQDLRLWDGVEEFRNAWRSARQRLDNHQDHRESTVYERIRHLIGEQAVRRRVAWEAGMIDAAAGTVHQAYWAAYRSKTYLLPEVRASLEALRMRGIEMGVVSNFMVPGGIEDLLGLHNIKEYFRAVVVSCDVGWRKPSPRIFLHAIDAAGFSAGEILFVGDNRDADYLGSRTAGFQAVLYDRKDANSDVDARISSLVEIESVLDKIAGRLPA